MHRHTDQEMREARRMLIQSVSVLTHRAQFTPNRAARNVMFHAEELMKSLDAFWAGREPDDELNDE